MTAPVDVLAVMGGATKLLMASGREGLLHADKLNVSHAAVAELIEAVAFASEALAVGGAPTRSQCQEMQTRFSAALARVGGAK